MQIHPQPIDAETCKLTFDSGRALRIRTTLLRAEDEDEPHHHGECGDVQPCGRNVTQEFPFSIEIRPVEAMDPLLEALTANPHAVSVHETIWRVLSRLRFEPALVERYLSVSREAVFYQDPHVCLKCHYRSTECLWQCPHCHEWNSFVQERLTAASEDADMRSVGQD